MAAMYTDSALKKAPFASLSRIDTDTDGGTYYDEGGEAANVDHCHRQEGAPGSKYVTVTELRSRRIAPRH